MVEAGDTSGNSNKTVLEKTEGHVGETDGDGDGETKEPSADAVTDRDIDDCMCIVTTLLI